MKKIFACLLLSLAFTASSEIIEVRRMAREEGMDRSFVFKTNIQDKVVLDCQSFIQGLRIGEYEEAYTYLLDPHDCEDLYKRVSGSLRMGMKHCIDAEDEIRSDRSCI